MRSQVTQRRPTTRTPASLPGPIDLCHELLAARIERGDFAVDATVGNGHDTLLLADLVGPDGLVYGFDVQRAALQATAGRIAESGFDNRVRLIHAGHEDAAGRIDPFHRSRIKAVVFNLGYLPGGDRTVTTRASTTVSALRDLLNMLMPGGLITIVLYRRHPGGEEESKEVIRWCRDLDPRAFQVTSYGFVNRPNQPPFAILIDRIAASVG